MKKLIIKPEGEQLIDLTQQELNQIKIDNQKYLVQEKLKQEKVATELAKKQSAIAKLKALGLDEEEVKAIIGI
jgi:predicted XRE-type DNA-binding protein